jgi:hypothetical protein
MHPVPPFCPVAASGGKRLFFLETKQAVTRGFSRRAIGTEVAYHKRTITIFGKEAQKTRKEA